MKTFYQFINWQLTSIFLVVVIFAFYSNSKAQETDSNEQRRITYKARYLESEKYFNRFKNDSSIYFGEGFAKIENDDMGEAINKAKTNARDNLARNIKVVVKSTVNLLMSSKSKSENHQTSEQINESIDIQTKTYTEQLLTEVKQTEFKIDYPTRNHVTIIYYIGKNDYHSIVEKDIEGKKKFIRESILNGNKKYNTKHYPEAIKDWLFANESLVNFFQGLPIQDDIDGTGLPQEVNAYINDKITTFFSSVKLKEMSENLLYDVRGQLNNTPIIYAEYEDEYGNVSGIEDLPLKINFIEGTGKVRKKIVTGIYGQAKVGVSEINSNSKNIIIRISIDSDAFPGINRFQNLLLPYLDISMNKMKTVALAVTFNNGGNFSTPDQLKNSIQSELLNNGLQVVPFDFTKKNVSDSDFGIINSTNADYFIYAYIQSNKGSKVGGYDNMFISSSSGTLYIYQLPQGQLVSTKELSPVKGYGVSASSAGWNGYSKLSSQVSKGIETAAESLK